MAQWRGKLLGLVLGWLLLRHTAGGLLGLLLGHAFDAGWFQPPAADPYRVFGLTSDASDAEIDLAWRRLMSQYHPDRVAGAAPDLQRQAEAKSRELNAAYDRIRQLRRK